MSKFKTAGSIEDEFIATRLRATSRLTNAWADSVFEELGQKKAPEEPLTESTVLPAIKRAIKKLIVAKFRDLLGRI